jgi:predicted deacylase
MSYSEYFHNSYEECRRAFLSAAKKVNLPATVETIPVNESEENLFTDIIHIKNTGVNPLVIINSGLHGVEGYVGSALQLVVLDQIINGKLNTSGMDLLLVHAVNPWGFKNNRRVTRNNVDLNRNFSVTEDLFKIKNEGYAKMKRTLQPESRYFRWSLDHIAFPFKILKNIIKYSRSTLVQAIGEGQYEYERGIIYGGNRFEEETITIANALQRYCSVYNKILIIDLHTGLGKKGKLQLLNAPKIPVEVKCKVNELFDNRVIDDSDSNFFKEHGSFLDFAWEINKERVCLPVMFEFGTLNSDNLLGGLHTLKTMIIENQVYQNGFKSSSDKTYVESKFIEMFYPKNLVWRNEVVIQFQDVFSNVVRKLTRDVEF